MKKPKQETDTFFSVLVVVVVLITVRISTMVPEELASEGGSYFGLACIAGAVAMFLWLNEENP